MTRLDLILRGGRVIDPGQGLDAVRDVGFAEGKVAAIAERLDPADAAQVRDVTGRIVMPGMIDFHAHVYWGGTSIGVDADKLARRCGTTTWLDVGTAGANNIEGFRRHVIEASETRILAYLHISTPGIYAFSKDVMVGESEDLRLLHVRACARAAAAHKGVVCGVKVRVGKHASGWNGITPLHLALEAADLCGLPVMCHIDEPPPRYEDVLAILRPGDTLTHCFRPAPNAPVTADGRIKDACWRARERGIYFDIGHGMGSFAFRTARAMLAAGFAPDIISSDVHALCIDGPAFDNLETMSKFLALGMDLGAVVKAVTVTPATALGRPDLADLAVGSTGDATVLAIRDGSFVMHDVTGEALTAERKLFLDSIVLGGRLWHTTDS
jgi:dihydroorotase